MNSPRFLPKWCRRQVVGAVALLLLGCGKPAANTPLPRAVPGCRFDGWMQYSDARGKVLTGMTFEPQADDETVRQVVAGIDPGTIQSIAIESPRISLSQLVQFPNLQSFTAKGKIPLQDLPPSKTLTCVGIESERFRESDAQVLAALPSLTRLHLSIQSRDGLQTGATDVIGKCPTLRYLTVQFIALSTADCRGLGQSRSLIELDLLVGVLGRAELQELAQIATLQTLVLRQAKIEEEALAGLDAAPALKSVELESCSLTDRSVQELWGLSLEKIALTPGARTRLTADCLTGIPQATSLNQLVISAEGLDEPALQSIVTLPSMEKVILLREPAVSAAALDKIRQNNGKVRILLPQRID